MPSTCNLVTKQDFFPPPCFLHETSACRYSLEEGGSSQAGEFVHLQLNLDLLVQFSFSRPPPLPHLIPLIVWFVRALFKHLIQLPNYSNEQVNLMLRWMRDEVIVLATLSLCIFHFCTSSVIRSGFLYCTSNLFFYTRCTEEGRGKRRGMKGMKRAFNYS